QGIPGAQGPKGDKGDTGPQGPKGDKGDGKLVEIAKGTNIAAIERHEGDTLLTFTVNANGAEVSGSGNVKVTPSAKEGNVTEYAVSLVEKPEFKGITLAENGSRIDLAVGDNALILNGADNNAVSIRNVADGRIAADSKEAVNGSQLYEAIGTANAKFGDVYNKIGTMDKDLQAGIAGATAMAFLQRPNEAGKSMMSVATAGYRNQTAVAVGIAHNSDNNKYSVKFGVGVNSRRHVNWGGSLGYQW
ncbi:MAG: YadA-like family protein, partial [Neisseria sp.]|nr:YadA-like family protein [Neisseria sp.]